MSKRFNFTYVQDYILRCNGTLLSNSYDNNRTHLSVKCNTCEHVWDITFKNIRKGHWCPQCARNIKYTFEYVREIIRNKNGTLLSQEYNNSRSPLQLKCNKCGHHWTTKFSHIVSNHWCAKCAGILCKDLSYARKIIEDKGGILLSTAYINSNTPLLVICCKCNNKWTPTIDNIKAGKWCKYCSSGKTQKKLFKIVKEIYSTCNAEYDYSGFKWLKNAKNGKSQHIDIYVHNINRSFSLAIEYDGEQHFLPINYCGNRSKAENRLKKIQARDIMKDNRIKEHPFDIKYFIRFNYRDHINLNDVTKKLHHNKIPIFFQKD